MGYCRPVLPAGLEQLCVLKLRARTCAARGCAPRGQGGTPLSGAAGLQVGLRSYKDMAELGEKLQVRLQAAGGLWAVPYFPWPLKCHTSLHAEGKIGSTLACFLLAHL